MKLVISFLHLEHTEALDTKIQEKSEKFNKFFEGKTEMKWNCYVKDGRHHADVTLLGPHQEYHASAYTDCLYKTLDQVCSKLEKQLVKQKGKWRNKINKSHTALKELEATSDLTQEVAEYEENYETFEEFKKAG